MSNKRVHLICAAANCVATDALLTAMHGTNQGGSQCIPLSASGSNPPTHYGSTGLYNPAQVTEIETWDQGAPTFWKVCAGYDNELPHFDEFAAEKGLAVIPPAPMPDE